VARQWLRNWGTGTPRRELLHVDDLASACLYVLENFDGPIPVNMGTGMDHTVGEIADIVGYSGETRWDPTKPDGTPRKLLDVSVLREAGWHAKIALREGIESTVACIARTPARRGNDCALRQPCFHQPARRPGHHLRQPNSAHQDLPPFTTSTPLQRRALELLDVSHRHGLA
jgi:hypothetical protein